MKPGLLKAGHWLFCERHSSCTGQRFHLALISLHIMQLRKRIFCNSPTLCNIIIFMKCCTRALSAAVMVATGKTMLQGNFTIKNIQGNFQLWSQSITQCLPDIRYFNICCYSCNTRSDSVRNGRRTRAAKWRNHCRLNTIHAALLEGGQ